MFYANSATNTVLSDSIIPLGLGLETPLSTFDVADNQVVVGEEGYYLVSYFADGSVPTGEFITSLYVNGTAVTGESLIQYASSGAGQKTVLLLLQANDTLSLYNTSTNQATLSGASITAVKLA